MKRLVLVFLALSLIAIFSVGAHAKNTREPALADILPGGCSEAEIAPFGNSLLVGWDWENGTTQTKFGGDALFMVSGSYQMLGGAETFFEDVSVEINVKTYEPGTPAEDYVGVLVYRCSNDQALSAGSCNGAILDLMEAVFYAVADELGLAEGDTLVISESDLIGVFVKAMNPSFVEDEQNKIKRQNFPLVNVCNIAD